MSDMPSLPRVFPVKRRQATKRRSDTAAVNAAAPVKQVDDADRGLGRVTGAAQEVCWTVGGGSGASIGGGSRVTELVLAPVNIAATSDTGSKVTVLSDGTAITSMDVARLIPS